MHWQQIAEAILEDRADKVASMSICNVGVTSLSPIHFAAQRAPREGCIVLQVAAGGCQMPSVVSA